MQENLENYSALNRSLRCLRYRNQFHSVYNVVFKDTLRTVWLKDPKQVWYWIIPLYKKEKKGKKKEEYRRRKTAELMRFCGEHSSFCSFCIPVFCTITCGRKTTMKRLQITTWPPLITVSIRVTGFPYEIATTSRSQHHVIEEEKKACG